MRQVFAHSCEKEKIFFKSNYLCLLEHLVLWFICPEKIFFDDKLTWGNLHLENEVKKREIEDSGIYPFVKRKFFALTSWFPVCGALRRGQPEQFGFGKNAVWSDVAKDGTFFPFDGATGQFGLARALAAGRSCAWRYIGCAMGECVGVRER